MSKPGPPRRAGKSYEPQVPEPVFPAKGRHMYALTRVTGLAPAEMPLS